MASKIVLALILVTLTIYDINCEIPVFKCNQMSNSCIFYNVVLNSTHFEWQPTADDPKIVTKVTFYDSVIPVVTKVICETFPALQELFIYRVGMKNIEEGAFDACRALTLLHIYDNELKEIPKNTFQNTKNMNELWLYENRIEKLDDDNLFANMPVLKSLQIQNNNLTFFSPDLIRNNKELTSLHLFSNDLSDIDAEAIVEALPKLDTFSLNDNEISCTRFVEINNMLNAKKVYIGGPWVYKVRYYEQAKVFDSYTCNPDVSWMASHYRKENYQLERKVVEMEKDLERLNQQFEKLQQKIDSLINFVMH